MSLMNKSRRYEALVLVSLTLLVATLVGVLVNAGMNPQVVA